VLITLNSIFTAYYLLDIFRLRKACIMTEKLLKFAL
jgi:hypothetical protein